MPVHAAGTPIDRHAAVLANDNTRPAGTVEDRTVTVRLRAARGRWHPESDHGPSLMIDAFGEDEGPLTVPAPLIRVTEGTTIVVVVRNQLGVSLRIHGLCARNGSPCPPIDVPAGSVREARFVSGQAGTYHYWATSLGAPIPFRELAGALIVDPPDGTAAPDRIFVITEWSDLTATQLREILMADDVSEAFWAARPVFTFVINGLSWPATERLTYRQGDVVRWRVLNLTSQAHPMHLHGFYFLVTRTGDGARDEPVDGGAGREVVTELLRSGGTVSLEWRPERPGNWLFHCHIMAHVSPTRRLPAPSSPVPSHPHSTAGQHHTHAERGLGMAGMVLGISVLPAADAVPTPAAAVNSRRIGMVIGRDRARGVAMGVALHESGTVGEPSVTAPGPPLVLRRGEPVEITVVNHLDEATSIHWHGLEIESLYDGVHGWSGDGRQTAPMINPGASFVVRLTPPRAGTFIYHTHVHDYRQLSSGLYGALIVTELDAAYDPTVDHVIVFGRRDASEASSVIEDRESIVLNGSRTPRWVWSTGRTHRLRFINITPDDQLRVAMVRDDAPATWRAIAKDGAPRPADRVSQEPAAVTLAVGETFDVELEATSRPGTLWIEARSPSGKWQAQGQVILK